MSQTPPPASPQSALSLQIRLAPELAQCVWNGSFAPVVQNSPVGQSAGSSQAMVHSPGHCPVWAGAMQLGAPVVERQQRVVVRSHWVDPHVT
jgi:hypothetical protein